jgi:hypothetical protein
VKDSPLGGFYAASLCLIHAHWPVVCVVIGVRIKRRVKAPAAFAFQPVFIGPSTHLSPHTGQSFATISQPNQLSYCFCSMAIHPKRIPHFRHFTERHIHAKELRPKNVPIKTNGTNKDGSKLAGGTNPRINKRAPAVSKSVNTQSFQVCPEHRIYELLANNIQTVLAYGTLGQSCDSAIILPTMH